MLWIKSIKFSFIGVAAGLLGSNYLYADCPNVKAYCYQYIVDSTSPIPATDKVLSFGSKWSWSDFQCHAMNTKEQFISACEQHYTNILSVVYPAQDGFITAPTMQIEKTRKANVDYSHWMEDLTKAYPKFTSLAIKSLILPGSHDSATDKITQNSAIAPDAPDLPEVVAVLEKLGMGNLINSIYAGWSKAEPLSISEQLASGIRYLDLRLCDKSGDIYSCHGRYSDAFKVILEQIKAFSDAHPNELLILDINHLYNVNLEAAYQLIYGYLGDKLASYNTQGEYNVDTPLEKFINHKKPIIVLFADGAFTKAHPLLWPQSAISSPWPNKQTIADQLSAMSNNLNNRDDTKLFVLQMQLTPNQDTIISGILKEPKTLHNLSLSYKESVYDWLDDHQKDVLHNGNILMEDWSYGKALTALAIRLNTLKVQKGIS